MSYLVDTNVFSEQLKPRPSRRVIRWLEENESEIYVSTITIAEIRRGIERLPEGKRKDRFSEWLSTITRTMRGSVLSFNRSVAHVWGQMQGRLDGEGITLSAFDSIIAATAIRHDLAVCSRNVRDFQRTGVTVINPFEDTSG